jgi:tetrahydromethanopterin S-methyltransferase subunit G
MRGQLIGGGIGAAFGLVVGILMMGKRKVVVSPPVRTTA